MKKNTSYDAKQILESEEGWYLFNAAWKNWRRMFLELRGDSLLDLGCGSGVSLALAQLFKPDIVSVGIEVDESAFPIWEKRKVNVKLDDIYNLNFNDNEFDTVWSSHVLEHLENPEEMVLESFRVAKYRVIHSVPIGNVDDRNLGSPHLRYFDRLCFRRLFDKCDYKELKIDYVEDSYMNSMIAILDKE
ncbi:class I SAM-dependent methyltransferase [Alphaproteobacteria bacterium]|nr:class I SAM-dependent methyltransferase [Alphaproteobacteria bacterium]